MDGTVDTAKIVGGIVIFVFCCWLFDWRFLSLKPLRKERAERMCLEIEQPRKNRTSRKKR